MATTLQQDIRESLTEFDENIVFSYGRSLDNALKSAKEDINSYLVCLDPPSYTGSLIDSNETKQISLSWLKLDQADSEADEVLNDGQIESMEAIVKDCHDKGVQWLKSFADTHYNKYTINNYTGFEAFRVKHMMTGFVFTLSVSHKLPC